MLTLNNNKHQLKLQTTTPPAADTTLPPAADTQLPADEPAADEPLEDTITEEEKSELEDAVDKLEEGS